jgi:hypothetical protein
MDVIHGRLCKKILGMIRFAANGVAELGLGRDIRRSKVLCFVVKYRLRIFRWIKEELVRVFYELKII